MPPLSRCMVRLALIYLVIGTGCGAWRLAALAGTVPGAAALGVIHRDLVLLGWLAHLALGTGYWILPRLPGEQPRGNPWLAWLALALLDGGLLLSALAAAGGPSTPPVTGRGLSGAGLAIFVCLLWPRARAFGAFGSGAGLR